MIKIRTDGKFCVCDREDNQCASLLRTACKGGIFVTDEELAERKVKCPNPGCKNGVICDDMDLSGDSVTNSTCPTCGGTGYTFELPGGVVPN